MNWAIAGAVVAVIVVFALASPWLFALFAKYTDWVFDKFHRM